MRFKFFRVLVVAIFFFSTPVWSQPCEKVAAVIESMEGGGVVKPLETERWQPVKVGHQFCYGDTFKVEKLRAVLRLENDTLVKLNSGSVLKFVPPKESFWVELVDGVAHFISRTPKSFTVKAPYVNAAVEGTEFIIAHRDQQDTVSVVEGLVVAENTLGSTRLQAMQQSTVVQGGAPSHALVISLPDVADWSLYYPPAFIPSNTKSPAVQAYSRGDFALSYQLALEEKDAELTAVLALFYGQSTVFDESIPLTGPLVAQVLSIFQSIVSGEKTEALTDAKALVAFYPEQSNAFLVLSYAQQANGQLSLALTSALKAGSLSKSAIVDLRIAELALITGDQSLAKQHLKHLDKADFYSSYAASLRALIALQNNRNRKASKILKTSLDKNPNVPLTQFATGLTYIRLGELQAGREKLELAVALDPSNSLYRSYLGKAYAEEYRAGKAQDQLDLAKILDPDDPTPWFYQGLNLQANGEYAGAIAAYEESLALNDARYTYRSSNVLQSDAAIKSANIGTAYSQRGLKKKAELLGSEIISEDPNSYAGHRLLLEAYSDDSQRESLLASSRLKATIYQPLGAKALPIGLLEPGLQTAIGASPTDIGISEYTQLFIEDGIDGHATLLGGSDGLRAYDVLVQGKREQVSINLGQYRYETDGYRENNDVSYLLSNALVHWMPSSDLSLQFEYGEFDDEHGDLTTNLDADIFLPYYRINRDSSVKRMSANYSIDVRDSIIINYSKRQRSYGYRNKYFDGTQYYDLMNDTVTSSNQSEAQFQRRSNTLGTFVLGLSHFDHKYHGAEFFFGQEYISEENFSAKSAYVDYRKTINNVFHVALGLDYSALNQSISTGGDFAERDFSDQLLPYVGTEWDIFSGITLRGSYSEAYAFDSKSYVDLKAIGVAGFDRVLDFRHGTKVDLVGFGFDWEFGEGLDLYVERKNYDLVSAVYNQGVEGYRYVSLPINLVINSASFEYTKSSVFALILKLGSQKYNRKLDPKAPFVMPLYLDSDSADVELKFTPISSLELSVSARYLHQELIEEVRPDREPVSRENSATLSASMSHYFFRRQGSLKLSVNNLTNEKYLVVGQDKFSLLDDATGYALGRSYVGSITYTF